MLKAPGAGRLMCVVNSLTIMDKTKALALIERQRRYGCAPGTDYAIAGRAARQYLVAGLLSAAATLMDALGNAHSGKLATWWSAFTASLLVFSFVLCWRSWRFTQIRRLLEERGT